MPPGNLKAPKRRGQKRESERHIERQRGARAMVRVSNLLALPDRLGT